MIVLLSQSAYVTIDDVTITTEDLVSKTIGKSKAQGLDLEAKAELTKNLSIAAGYSYMKTKVINDEDSSIKGNEFVTAPRNTASLWSHYTLPNQLMNVGLGVRYVGSYYLNVNNTSKSNAATLFDVSFGYHITPEARLNVNVKNLLDKQYVVGAGSANYYNPGREVIATLSYNW